MNPAIRFGASLMLVTACVPVVDAVPKSVGAPFNCVDGVTATYSNPNGSKFTLQMNGGENGVCRLSLENGTKRLLPYGPTPYSRAAPQQVADAIAAVVKTRKDIRASFASDQGAMGMQTLDTTFSFVAERPFVVNEVIHPAVVVRIFLYPFAKFSSSSVDLTYLLPYEAVDGLLLAEITNTIQSPVAPIKLTSLEQTPR